MKSWRISFIVAVLSLITVNSYAGVVIEGTRLVYPADKKETSMTVNNPDPGAYLIQSWIENSGKEKAPFVVTPPLFRLESGKSNVLRVVRAGSQFPQDRESLYWLNIKAIPSVEKKEGANVLHIAVKSRMKLIYRPVALKNVDWAEVNKQLAWRGTGKRIQVNNPTPYVISFRTITVNGKDLAKVGFVMPFSAAEFDLPSGQTKGKVTWRVINDYGGAEDAAQGSF